MIGKKMNILVVAVAVLFAGIYVVAQDINEDSLLAMEEMTLTDSVEGDLPSADFGEDDLLAELLAGDTAEEADGNMFEEDVPLDALSLEDNDDDMSALLEDFDSADLSDNMEDVDNDTPELDAPEALEDLDEDFDLGDAMDDLGGDTIEEDTISDESPVAGEEVVAEEDFSMDDLLGELTAEEPIEDTPTTDAVVADIEEVAGLEEISDEEDFSMDDLLGELTAEEPTADLLPTEDVAAVVEEPIAIIEEDIFEEDIVADLDDVVEEKGVDVDEDILEIDDSIDMDSLIDELADEGEADLGFEDLAEGLTEPVEVVEEIVEEIPEIIEEPAPVALVEIAEEPEDYIDEMALDDDLFKSLADEAKVDLAVDKSGKSLDLGEEPEDMVVEPEFDVDDLIESLAEEAESEIDPVEAMEDVAEVVIDAPVEVAPEVVEKSMEEIDDLMPTEEMVEMPIVEEPIITKNPKVAAFEAAERTKRIGIESHAIQSIQNAENELATKDYVKAIILFEEALKYLPARNDLIPMRDRARKGLAGACYLRALSLERMGEFENAKAAALDSVKYGYKKGEETVKRIQDAIDKPEVLPPKPKPERWHQSDYVEKQKSIKAWLKRGREAYLTGEYRRAIINFESVLARDPENKEAMRLRKNASQKLYDRTSAEIDGTRTSMMTEVRGAWSPRAKYGEFETPIQENEQTIVTTDDEDKQRSDVIKKMREIRIPEINFRQANIRDVVDFLHEQSVASDPANNPEERRGVNIILKLGNDAAEAAPKAAPNPWDIEEGAGLGGGAGGGETLITFSALDISLEDALDVVVDYANLKYIIRGNMVRIMPKNQAIGTIDHRMYNVLSSAIDRLKDLTQAVAAKKPRGGGGGFALEGNDNLAGEEGDLKMLFAELGVPWPEGTSIKYVRGLSKLVVANTLENLTIFEKILKELNVVPYQIEIETRFVEVAQTDVDSLGLEWMLNDDWEIAERKSDAGLPLSQRQRIVLESNSADGGFTAGNRYLPDATFDGQTIADNLLSFTSILTSPELGVVLHAIQQKGHSDLLSAPKVTTISGQPATIKVVTEYIYPTQYTLIEAQGQGGENAGIAPPAVEPGAFETREVGVILDVLAEVSTDGQMINLTLAPEVVTDPVWHDYGYDYFLGNMGGGIVTTHLNMEQPFFHSRSLQTNLLIYNGATVVMGGMITEVRTDVDDKIPILGDIPIIGRLFSSRYESSEKRNLLIFVTARLVDPSGRALGSDRFGIDGAISTRVPDAPAAAAE